MGNAVINKASCFLILYDSAVNDLAIVTFINIFWQKTAFVY
jgi:hypothetical protein